MSLQKCPIITKFISNESDLNFLQLQEDEWIEEFEINKIKDIEDFSIMEPTCQQQ